jgi:hypothetical protein
MNTPLIVEVEIHVMCMCLKSRDVYEQMIAIQ